MRIPLAVIVIALTACADLREPSIDGNIGAVSKSDVPAITAAVDRFLAERHRVKLPIFRIHVINQNQVQVYCGEHYGSQPRAGDESYIEVNRIKGRWKATEKVIRY